MFFVGLQFAENWPKRRGNYRPLNSPAAPPIIEYRGPRGIRERLAARRYEIEKRRYGGAINVFLRRAGCERGIALHK